MIAIMQNNLKNVQGMKTRELDQYRSGKKSGNFVFFFEKSLNT